MNCLTRIITQLFLYCIALCIAFPAFGRTERKVEINLTSGKNKVVIATMWCPWIGLTTQTDTIKFKTGDREVYNWEITDITKDSILVRKPKKYRDTAIVRVSDFTWMPKPHRYMDSYHRDKKKYDQYLLIEEFKYKRYALKDITSIQYPPRADNVVGCIFCVLMPFLYPTIYKNYRDRTIPKSYDLSQWKLEVIEELVPLPDTLR